MSNLLSGLDDSGTKGNPSKKHRQVHIVLRNKTVRKIYNLQDESDPVHAEDSVNFKIFSASTREANLNNIIRPK